MRKYASYHTRHRRETSKGLLMFTLIMVIVISLATIIAVFVLKDVTPLEYLITGIFGLATTSTGFYYWKAKNENIAKYGNNDKGEEDGYSTFQHNNII